MFHRTFVLFLFAVAACSNLSPAQVTVINPPEVPTPPTLPSPPNNPRPLPLLPLVMITPGMPRPNTGGETGYQEPVLPVKLFDAEKINLSPEQRGEMATGIANALKLITSQKQEIPNKLASKALAFAFNLDPDNREATIVNSQFRESFRPQDIPSESAAADIARKLEAKFTELKANSTENSKIFRNLALDLAVEFDISNENLLLEYELNRKAGEQADWSSILGPPLLAPSPNDKQESMLTLVAPTGVSFPNPKSRYLRMYGTLQTGNGASSRLMVWGNLSPEMLAIYQESERSVKILNPNYPKDADVSIRFSARFIRSEGNQSGITLALLLLALTGQVSLDPNVGFAGVLKEDGNIRGEDTIDVEVLRNISDVHKRAAIPEDSLWVLEDMIRLRLFRDLWEYPVFFVKNLDEAKKFMSPETESKVAKANQSFEEAKKLLSIYFPPDPVNARQLAQLDKQRKKMEAAIASDPSLLVPPPDPLDPSTKQNSDAIRAKLEETLALVPNHATALVLLRSMKGELTKTLSLRGSLKKITEVLTLSRPGPAYPNFYTSKMERAPAALDAMLPLLDPAAKPLQAEILRLLRESGQSVKPTPGSNEETRQRDELVGKIKAAINKVRTENKIPLTVF